MGDQKNLLMALVISFLIIMGFHYLYDKPRLEKMEKEGITQQAPAAQQNAPILAPVAQAVPVLQCEVALAQSERVKIETPEIEGSISLMGGRIDHVVLKHHHESAEANSPKITLFAPKGTKEAYYADFGWVSAQKDLVLPNAESVWTASSMLLTPEAPITLTWTNPQGIVFHRHISIDQKFMFTVKEEITNRTQETLSVHAYGALNRTQRPVVESSVVYEGPLAYLEGSLEEISYNDLKEKKTVTKNATGGWLGFSDKYWMGAFLPSQTEALTVRFSEVGMMDDRPIFQTDYMGPAMTVKPGETVTHETHLFSGAKVLSALDEYETKLGVNHFDLAVDFGWFYFITKPLFYVLSYFYQLLGNFGLSILLLTVLVKIAFYPLANKSYYSMQRMKDMAPKIKTLQERYKDDKMRQQQELMAFYKKEKINPISGCLPMVIQIPVFFALYKVLSVSIEMRHAPFYGWIHDLSSPDPTSIFNLFGLLPWALPAFLMIGILPIIMGVTMYIQQKMTPQTTADPTQAKIMQFLPILFTYMLAQFPAGLVIYWTWNNILSIGQQWMISLQAKQKAA